MLRITFLIISLPYSRLKCLLKGAFKRCVAIFLTAIALNTPAKKVLLFAMFAYGLNAKKNTMFIVVSWLNKVLKKKYRKQ